MAKRTLDQFNTESDAANGIKRTLLSTSANYDEISNEVGPQAEPVEADIPNPEKQTTSGDTTVNQISIPIPDPSISLTESIKASVTVNTDASISDVPVSALESVKALVAGSLKKSSSEIKLDSSIKTLSGGRSTIQNEIIGDMLEEFGPLADDAENLPIKELAAIIQKTYDGKLRKCLRTRIDKMMASKMPGSFDSKAVKTHLSSKWGLSSGRQDAVLLYSLSQQPTARFKRTEEAEAFLDSVAQAYMDSAGLARPATSSTVVVSPQQSLLDSKVVQELRDEHDSLKRKLVSLLLSDGPDNPQSSITTEEEIETDTVNEKLDIYDSELGDDFSNGIKPRFQVEQQRSYDSFWNWGHIDLLSVYYHFLGMQHGKEPDQKELLSIQSKFKNRWNERLETSRQYLVRKLSLRKDLAAQITRRILELLEPIESKSNQIMAANDDDESTTLQKEVGNPMSMVPGWHTSQVTAFRGQDQQSQALMSTHPNASESCPLPILRRQGASWVSHNHLTAHVSNANPVVSPNAFSSKDVLITGAGPNSIGITLLPSLLQGGARVVVVTSRPMPDAGPVYQKIFASCGGKGSKLVVLPCNQGIKQDVANLIAHIYDPVKGLGWDLDFILPFAALSEKGQEIDNLDSKSELAHRVMLTNVLRLMGAVKLAKEARGSLTRPAHVLLPLSPNMGTFGNDGL